MSESSRLPARYGERGGVPRPQDGAPPTSVDVLAAQVRAGIGFTEFGTRGKAAAAEALDALVARVTEAEEKEAYAWSCAEDVKGWAKRADEARRNWQATFHAERARTADARNALEDAHEFQCGCDRPGNPASCVAEPREAFEVLARLDGREDD